MPAGCSIANAIPRATASGGIAIRSRVSAAQLVEGETGNGEAAATTTASRSHDDALAGAGRRLMDLLPDLAQQVLGQGPEAALTLVEHHVVAAHGYVALYREGFFAHRYEGVAAIADRAVAESRTLLRGMRESPPPPGRP
jgi:hypothetical protein